MSGPDVGTVSDRPVVQFVHGRRLHAEGEPQDAILAFGVGVDVADVPAGRTVPAVGVVDGVATEERGDRGTRRTPVRSEVVVPLDVGRVAHAGRVQRVGRASATGDAGHRVGARLHDQRGCVIGAEDAQGERRVEPVRQLADEHVVGLEVGREGHVGGEGEVRRVALGRVGLRRLVDALGDGRLRGGHRLHRALVETGSLVGVERGPVGDEFVRVGGGAVCDGRKRDRVGARGQIGHARRPASLGPAVGGVNRVWCSSPRAMSIRRGAARSSPRRSWGRTHRAPRRIGLRWAGRRRS